MPTDVSTDPALCPARRTDAATVTIAVYRGAEARRVDIYEGCMDSSRQAHAPKVQALLALARAIDSTAGTKRWLPRDR